MSYLAGVCANQIKQNPAIITAMPSTITLAPIPVATIASPTNAAEATQASNAAGSSATAPPTAAPAGNVPVTTIQIQQTVTVPCTFSSGPSAGSAIPSSSTTSVVSSVITVPQVQFVTQQAAGTQAVVNLAAGTPPSTPAEATAAAVGASGANLPSIYAQTTLASAYAQSNPSVTANPSLIQFQGAGNTISPSMMISAVIGGILVLFCQL
ncbi:hypothetical protein MMC16_000170 [Acarospora aff. strigata]|nr:hypothetical protein [Acarospora aff. strigata]